MSEIICIDCDVSDYHDDADSLFSDTEPLITDLARKPANDVAIHDARAKSNGTKRSMGEDAGGGDARKKRKLFHSLSAENIPGLMARIDGPGVPFGNESTQTLTNGERPKVPVASSTTTNGSTIFPKSRVSNHDDEGDGSFSIPTPTGGCAPTAVPGTVATRGGFILDEDDHDDFVPEDDDTLFRAVVWKRPEAVPEATFVGGSSGGAAATATVNDVATAATGRQIDISRYPKGIQDRIAKIRAHQAEQEKAASVFRQKKQAAEKSRRMREETEERRRRRRSGSAAGTIQGVSVGAKKNAAVGGGLTAAFLEGDYGDAVTLSTFGGSRASNEEEKRLLDLAEDEAKKTPRHANPKMLDPAEKEAKRAQRDDVPTNAAVRAKQNIENIKRTSALPMAVQRGLVPARGVGLLDQIADRSPMDVREMLAPAGEEASSSRHFHPGMRKNTMNGPSADAGSFKVPRKESVFEKSQRERAAKEKIGEDRERSAKEVGHAPSSNGESTIPSILRDKIAKQTKKLSDSDAAVVRDHELAKERLRDLDMLGRAFRETARLSCMIGADELDREEVEKVFDFADLVIDRRGVGYAPRARVNAIKGNMTRRIVRSNVPEPDDGSVQAALVEMVGEERLGKLEEQFKQAEKESEQLKLQREANTSRRHSHKKRAERCPSPKRKKLEPKPRPEFHTGMAVAGKLGDYKYRDKEEEDLARRLMTEQLAKFDQAKQTPAPVLQEASTVYEDSESEESVDETGAEIYASFGEPVIDSPVVPSPVKVTAQHAPKDSPKAFQMPSPPVGRVATSDSLKSSPTAIQMPSPRSMSREEQASETDSPDSDFNVEESLFDEPRDVQVTACRFIVRAEFWNMAGNDSDIFEVGRFHSLSSASARLIKTVEKYKCRCWISPEMITGDRYERPSIPESCYVVGWEKKDAKTQSVIEHDIVDQLITGREHANADAAQLLLQWYLQFIDIDSGEYEMTNERIAEMYQKQEGADGLFEYSGSMVLNDGTVEEMHVRVRELRTGQTDHSSSE